MVKLGIEMHYVVCANPICKWGYMEEKSVLPPHYCSSNCIKEHLDLQEGREVQHRHWSSMLSHDPLPAAPTIEGWELTNLLNPSEDLGI